MTGFALPEPPLADFPTACSAMHDHGPVRCAPGVGEGKPLYVTHGTSRTRCADCGDPFDEAAAGFVLASRDDEAVCDTCAVVLDPGGHRALKVLHDIEDSLDGFLEQDHLGELHDYLGGIARGVGYLLAELGGGTHILAVTEPNDPDQF